MLGTMDSDKRLRLVLVCLYMLTLATTLITSISLGWSVRIFSNECPLHASMSLSLGPNKTITLDELNTVWGKFLICNFCTFAAVLGTILSIMWFWFYILLSNFTLEELNGTKLPPDTRLLLPSMVINIPMFIIALVVAAMITDGRSFLCRQVHISIADECNVAGTMEWLHPIDGRSGWNYIRVAQWGAWGWVIFLLCTILVGTFRVHHFIQTRVEAFSSGSFSSSTSSLESTEDDYYYSSSEESGDDLRGFQNPVYDRNEGVTARTRSRGSTLERVEEQEEPDIGGALNTSAVTAVPKLVKPNAMAQVLDEKEERTVGRKGKGGKHKTKGSKKTETRT